MTYQMDPDEMIDVGTVVNRMQERGFFMAIWSPGQVTTGRNFFEYARWRVHFQRGAIQAAPIYEAEGYGEGDTLFEALQNASVAAMKSYEEFLENNKE